MVFVADTSLGDLSQSGVLGHRNPLVGPSLRRGERRRDAGGEIGELVVGGMGAQVAKQAADMKLTKTVDEKADGLLEGIRDSIPEQ